MSSSPSSSSSSSSSKMTRCTRSLQEERQYEEEEKEEKEEEDLTRFPPSLVGKRILLCAESFGPVNGVSRTTLMLVNHLRSHGVQVAVVAPHNHTNHNTFSPPPSPPLSPVEEDADEEDKDKDKDKDKDDDDENDKTSSSSSSSSSRRRRNGSGPRSKKSKESKESGSTRKSTSLLQPEVRLTGYPLPFNPELSIVYPVRNSVLYARTFGADVSPDLIYLASPASLGFQVMLQLRQQPDERQVPVLCNFQTDLSGYCEILFPAPLSHLAVWVLAAVQGYLFRHRSVRTVFYPSRFVRRYLEGQRVQADKLEVLRRGVDADLFHPRMRSDALRRDLAPRGGETVFVTVSRIAGEKGFDFLAKVAAELDARGLAFKLLIVGGNRNPAVEKEVQELFDLGLRESGKVVFAGFKVGQDLATAYASGDVFLHCSVTETFGLVVLEAMASGVPVIARDEGGPSDIVGHGETGYLVPPDDLRGFVDRAVSLAEDPALRFRLARGARRAAERATWDSINNKVAWRMADTIAQRESEQQNHHQQQQQQQHMKVEQRRHDMHQKVRVLQQHDSPTRHGALPPSPPPSPELSPFPSPSSLSPITSASSLSPSNDAQQQQQQQQQHKDEETPPLLCGWIMLSQAVRDALKRGVVDARLLGGLGVILACWAFTGSYVFFTECLLWSKARMKPSDRKRPADKMMTRLD